MTYTHTHTPTTDTGRIEVRSDGRAALVVPSLTPAGPLMAAYRQLEAQGWHADPRALFERHEHEDHIGLIPR